MNATKFIIATAATLSVIGAASFAYGQATSPSGTTTNGGSQQPMSSSTPTAPMDSSMPNSANTGSMNSTDTSNSNSNSNTGTGTTNSNSNMGSGTSSNSSNMGGTASTSNRTTMPSDGSTIQTERVARADRN